MKSTKITAGILSAALALTLCACGSGNEQAADDTIAISVGDAVMTKADLESYINGYTVNGLDLETAKEYAIEDVTNMLSAEALFAAEGLSYTDEDLAEQKAGKDAVIANFGGEDGYNDYLDSMGVTNEFIDRMLNASYAEEKIFADYVSDDAVREKYEEDYLHAKHILLATMDTATQEKYDDAKIAEQKALADELLKRAQGGEDFDAMVAEYSEDPGSISQPDGYYFTAGEMVSEFEDTTRSLGMNEIGICESTYGYHIIKRLPLEDNEDAFTKIRQQLLQTAITEKMPEILEQHGLKVEVNQEVVDSITE